MGTPPIIHPGLFDGCVETKSTMKNVAEVSGGPLLAIIALSAVQSFPRLLIHNAIWFINTSTMLGTREVIG